MARTLVVLSLVGLLLTCPFICGAGEGGHGTHRHRAAEGPPSDDHAPVHCPEGGDNCICEGAVQAGDVRVPDMRDVGSLFAFSAILGTPPHPIPHLTLDGSPTGLGGWGDHSTVRAFLQNYRC